MKIILPFTNPKKYPLTQKFGERFMYNGVMTTHQGIDYGMPKYTDIIAPFDGRVQRTTPERTTGYGRAVYIKHKDAKKGILVALMAHLETILVEPGMKVKQGNIVGQSGRTGFWRGYNGYHVHFGLSVSGKYIDPFTLLKEQEEGQESLFNQDDAKLKSFLGGYTVEKGDSLWKISEKYYESGGHYMEIFHSNEDILKNPNLIYPGQVLRIPVLKNKGI